MFQIKGSQVSRFEGLIESNIYIFLMGGTCCQGPIPVSNELQEPTPVEVKVLKKESSPLEGFDLDISRDDFVQKALNTKKPFQAELQKHSSTFKVKDYANGAKYLGQLDEQERPNGLGKLMKNDGSIIIGHFQKGVLQGRAFYANRAGVVLEGQVYNSSLNCKEGWLETPKSKYIGGFKDNLFDGVGIYATENTKFQGIYDKGRQKFGKLSWSDGTYLYLYQGNFDQNEKFTGNSLLIEPYGQYKGEFSNGEKNGKGRYTFNSGLVYQGQYKNGQREGKGKLINKDGTISYEGEFHKGLPNGRGKSFKSGSILHEGKFIDGIYEQLL